jgi:hypothetical protein
MSADKKDVSNNVATEVVLDETLSNGQKAELKSLSLGGEVVWRLLDGAALVPTKPLCKHELINGLIYAYNAHLPFRWRPDDLLLCIAMTVSNYVNLHAEELRKSMVAHQGQKQLKVEIPIDSSISELDWTQYIQQMKDEIAKNSISGLSDALSAQYTTTTPATATAASLSVMSTFQKYFSYSMVLGCGFPKMILEGTMQDWQQLQKQYQTIKTIIPDLQWWYTQMDVVIQLFLDMKALKPTGGVVAATEDMKTTWSRAVTWVRQGSGGQRFLGGWLHVLCPFTSSGHPLFKNTLHPCLNPKAKPDYDSHKGFYGYQDAEKDFYGTIDKDSIPSSILTVPLHIEQLPNNNNNTNNNNPTTAAKPSDDSKTLTTKAKENEKVKKGEDVKPNFSFSWGFYGIEVRSDSTVRSVVGNVLQPYVELPPPKNPWGIEF